MRDNEVNEAYQSLPWKILRIWECEINEENLYKLINCIKII